MAYRRSLVLRAKHYAQERFSPSLAYLHHDDDRRKHEDPKIHILARRGFVGSRSNNLLGFGEICQNRRSSQMHFPTLNGSFFARHMSTASGEAMEAVEAAIASQTPAVSEVAVAALHLHPFPPVAELQLLIQHLIEGVHSFTGLNWWVSIALTFILVHGMITTPILIYQRKKFEDELRPTLLQILKDRQQCKEEGRPSDATIDKYRPLMAKAGSEHIVSGWLHSTCTRSYLI